MQRPPYWQFQFRNLKSGWTVVVGAFAHTRNEALGVCAESMKAGWEFVGDFKPERAPCTD